MLRAGGNAEWFSELDVERASRYIGDGNHRVRLHRNAHSGSGIRVAATSSLFRRAVEVILHYSVCADSLATLSKAARQGQSTPKRPSDMLAGRMLFRCAR